MLQVFPPQAPPAPLARWIDGSVVIELPEGLGASHFPATSQAMLTVRLGWPRRHADCPPTVVSPPRFHTLSTVPTTYAHGGRSSALGLLVRPSAAACLLGASGGVVVNRVLDWRDVAGLSEAARLDHDLDKARTHRARLDALLQSFCRAMTVAARGRDQAFEQLCTAVGRHGARAGEQLGLGPRQLERRCQAALGVAPKPFQRLVRFRQALSMAETAHTSSLADVALQAGFFDQSHLARDARALLGTPLRPLVQAARPDPAWWSLAVGRTLSNPLAWSHG